MKYLQSCFRLYAHVVFKVGNLNCLLEFSQWTVCIDMTYLQANKQIVIFMFVGFVRVNHGMQLFLQDRPRACMRTGRSLTIRSHFLIFGMKH